MTDHDERIAKLERRLRDITIAASVIGACAVAFFGYTWTSIPKTVEALLAEQATDTLQQQIEDAVKNTAEFKRRAEEEFRGTQRIRKQAANDAAEIKRNIEIEYNRFVKHGDRIYLEASNKKEYFVRHKEYKLSIATERSNDKFYERDRTWFVRLAGLSQK